ncbi:MAG: exodeoxyribonuclease VII large subunit [Spirochaetia bacterium]|nr:exodeoxyribonuclease VII large subunit [Spirochaetia bacterium]
MNFENRFNQSTNQSKPDTSIIFSVAEISSLIKDILENSFMNISIEGELSNFRPASSGHWYFTLKDDQAAISAVMFRNRQSGLNFIPKDGKKVVVTGAVSVYEKRGTYQIICTSMRAAGEGDILALLEKRKQKLAAEGLFDSDRKQKLPLFPEKIVVITSPTGAALRDILQVLKRRNSGSAVRILPAAVQGEKAAETLSLQVQLANRYNLGDVIILGRGGGSLEDLLPFSDENLVRTVAASKIPVISAVGHEIDWALTDFAADSRAPTPSAAAELVSAQTLDLLHKIHSVKEFLISIVTGRVSHIRLLLGQFTADRLQENFNRLLEPLNLRIDDEKHMLFRTMSDILLEKQHKLALQRNSLEANSPLAILARGYAVVSDSITGKPLLESRNTEPGAKLHINLYKGSLNADVEEITS